jgi:Fic family protein
MAKDRSSEAEEPPLIIDRGDIARREAENTLRQFDLAMVELSTWIGKGSRYKLRPSTILKLNKAALAGLSKYAGVYRPGSIRIEGSSHAPVDADAVPQFVEEFCDYINDNWATKTAIHLSSYALWRLNWIHPFVDGNGRTARIVAYLVLCARLGYRLPGRLTIPEQISFNKQPYYEALEAADRAWQKQQVDVTVLEKLIDGHLAKQLVQVHALATGNDSARAKTSDKEKADAMPDEKSRIARTGVVAHLEAHPVLYGGLFLLLATVLTIAFSR